jgi:hypothetical protein
MAGRGMEASLIAIANKIDSLSRADKPGEIVALLPEVSALMSLRNHSFDHPPIHTLTPLFLESVCFTFLASHFSGISS